MVLIEVTYKFEYHGRLWDCVFYTNQSKWYIEDEYGEFHFRYEELLTNKEIDESRARSLLREFYLRYPQ